MESLKSALFERFGLNAFVQGNYEKAERWFRKLEEREPDSIRVLRNLGIVLLAKGNAEAAEKYLLREEKLYGQSFHRHAALADLAYARGKRREAEKRYTFAMADSECNEGGQFAASVPLMEKRRAICADEARFKKSREAMKLFEEAQKLRDSGELKEAIDLFLESQGLDETNWSSLNNAGSIYLNQMHNPGAAKVLFERAFEISRNIQVARNLDLAIRMSTKKKGGIPFLRKEK
jgi:Flp pilus assembly protein TadD